MRCYSRADSNALAADTPAIPAFPGAEGMGQSLAAVEAEK